MSDDVFLGIKSSSSWVTLSLDANSSGYKLLMGRLYTDTTDSDCVFLLLQLEHYDLQL